MKRTNRLTALLMALLMLLNLSASATETTNGIPLAELDKALYSTLLTDAEAVGQAANQECGANNPYCASVTKLVDMATAQERYDYLSGRSSLEIIGILMHYRDCKAEHTEEDVICLCAYPNFAADHVPGGITQPVECPWHFANLTVAEQYAALTHVEKSQYDVYKNTILDAEKKEALTAYLNYAEGSGVAPCNAASCPYVEEYQIDFFALNTFFTYDYLLNMYKAADTFDKQTEFYELASHLRDAHIAEGKYCQCWSFDISNPDHAFGTLHHSNSTVGGVTIECPWRFNVLTVAEQAQILNGISSETTREEYKSKLTAKQQAELEAFMAGIGKTEATVPSEDAAVTVEISVPTGVFGSGVQHVMEAEEALMTTEKVSALNQAMIGHTLAAFDISFYNLNRPGEKLQPVNGTVPLTFTVDVSEAEGNVMQVYHLIENANGACTAEAVGEPIPVDKTNGTQEITINASSFSTYALRIQCNGDGVDCGYNAFVAMNGFDREIELERLLGIAATDEEDGMTAYDEFVGHINMYHYEEFPSYCTCPFYKTNYEELGYGTINHVEDPLTPGGYCPWHLIQLTLADQYTVISGLTEKQEYLDALETAGKLDEYNAYVESLNPVEPEEPKTLLEIYEVYQQMTDEEKQAYLESLSPEMRDKLLRVNVTAYTATAANSSTVSIEVPEGAFGENYLLNAAEAEVTAEIQSALDALAVENGEETVGTLAAFDISFGNLATEQRMQPGAAVELTFDIPTASISEDVGALAVFHMVENSEGSYTAEVVGAIGIDTELEMQKIAVNATAFSIYVVGSVGEEPSGSSYTEYGMDINDTVVFYSSNRVNDTNTSARWRVGNTALTDGVAYTGNAAFIITPNGRYITVKKIADGEIELNYRVQYRWYGSTQNADDRINIINIIGPEEVTFRPNGGSGSDYQITAEGGAFVFPTLEETGITPPDGAEFAGWATSTTGYDTYAANIEGLTSTGTTYYARWYYPEATGTTRAYFFLRTDGAIQYEPATYGTSAYYPKPRTANGSSPRVDNVNGGYLHTPIAINNNLDAVAANIAVEPTAEMINAMLAYNNGGGGTFDPETQEVVWYVIKYTSNAWHVDGVIRQKALFNVSYHPNGGNTNVPASVQYAKDVTVTVDYQKVPSRIGYVFMGWDEDPTASSPTYDYDTKSPTSFVMPERNVDLYAIWRPSNATEYRVEHYLVETDGTTALEETTVHYGTTDSTVNARPRNYEGYALDSDYPGSIPSGVVAADGSLVLKLYYVRSLGNMKLTKVIDDPTFTSGTKLFSFTIQPSGSLPTSDEFVRWAEEKGFAVSGNVVTTGITVIHPAMTNSIQLSGLPTGSYKVTELNAEGYDTTYSPEDGIVNVTAGDTAAEITVTNEVSTGSLTVTKNVPDVSGDVDALPDQTFEFAIELTYPDGSTETETASLKRGETATFNDIPAGTMYTVTETAVDYFVTTKTGYSGTIAAGATSAAIFTNTYTKLKTGSLTITKNLVDSTFKSGSRTFTFTVQPSEGASDVMKKQFKKWAGDDAETVTITLTAPNETASETLTAYETLTGLPVGSYTVTETGLEPYEAYYKSSDVRTVNASVTTAGGTAAITNNAELTDLSVTKKWVDYSAATRPEKIKVSVMNGNDTLHSEEFTVDDSTNQKTYTFSRQFAKYDLQGNAIEYSFAEDAVANYSTSISGSTITNTIKTTSLTITKAGNVGSDEHFIFTVTSAQTDYNTTVVIKGAGTITISGLPIGDTIIVAEQTDWSWKYTAAYEGLTNGSITLVDGTNAVKVTNTPKTEQWLYDESSKNNKFTTTKN